MLRQAKKHPDKALALLRRDMLDWLEFSQSSIDICWMAVRVLKVLDIYEAWQQQLRPVAGQPAVTEKPASGPTPR